MRSYLLLAVYVCLLSVQLVASYPSGAPEQACKDLRPNHGAEPTSGAAPFELIQDTQTANAGNQIKGKLASNDH